MSSTSPAFETGFVSMALELGSLWGLRLFLLWVSVISLRNTAPLFLVAHGRSHRLTGGLQFVFLLVGVYTCNIENLSPWYFFLYDVTLGCLGTATTLTAASDFPHKYVKNAEGQSGSLSDRAIVTHAEMMEHSFYQVLNLVQVIFLHGLAFGGSRISLKYRFGALALATSPWTFRRYFPVHSFSSNWNKTPTARRTETEVLLYRIKKSQYIFYKHFVLHGLNVSFALSPSNLPWTRAWRIFWLHLNVSYVMEFFLQSLVKRKLLCQKEMLLLQRLLITSATLSSITPIFGHVRLELCAASLLLNFVHRYHDLVNTMLVAVGSQVLQRIAY